jgi:hypothetical protein
LGLALATARFAAAFPRAAFDSFLLLGRPFAPFFFWTFDDCFLRLAMIDPWLALGITKDKPPSRGNTRTKDYQQMMRAYPPRVRRARSSRFRS